MHYKDVEKTSQPAATVGVPSAGKVPLTARAKANSNPNSKSNYNSVTSATSSAPLAATLATQVTDEALLFLNQKETLVHMLERLCYYLPCCSGTFQVLPRLLASLSRPPLHAPWARATYLAWSSLTPLLPHARAFRHCALLTHTFLGFLMLCLGRCCAPSFRSLCVSRKMKKFKTLPPSPVLDDSLAPISCTCPSLSISLWSLHFFYELRRILIASLLTSGILLVLVDLLVVVHRV